MPSVVPGFEYDIFISYRHNDNRSGWVTDFVNALQEELAATIKEPLSIYFDKNTHDGLLETHNVDKSLEGKLKCLIFIPIISQTYCDTKSFAWQHEFCAFNNLARTDQFGRDIKLSNGNVASRILPVKIHELDPEDNRLLEVELGAMLRAIEFVHKAGGINRPLNSKDDEVRTPGKVLYRDQVNKVANAIKEIITSLKNPTSATRLSITNPPPVTKPAKNRKILVTSISLLFLLVMASYFLYPKLFFSANAIEKIDKSIAVLPFVNMSNDPDQEYFSDGLTEEIIDRLTKIPDLRVISRTSVMEYKKSDKRTPEIAKELGVAYILEGSVRKSENTLRITFQLIKAANDEHLWSETLDRPMTEIFQMQRDIATQLATYFKITLSESEKGLLSHIPTRSISAYDYYLKASEMSSERSLESKKAIELLKKALSVDPQFVDAMVTLAYFYAKRDNYESNENGNWPDSALHYATKAISISPNSPRANFSMGWAQWSRNVSSAKFYFKKSFDLNPSAGTGLMALGNIYLRAGLLDSSYYYTKIVIQLGQTRSAYSRLSEIFISISQWDSARYYMNLASNATKGSATSNDIMISDALKFYVAVREYESGLQLINDKFGTSRDPIPGRILVQKKWIYALQQDWTNLSGILTDADKEWKALMLKNANKTKEFDLVIASMKKENATGIPFLLLMGDYQQVIGQLKAAPPQQRYASYLFWISNPFSQEFIKTQEFKELFEGYDAWSKEMMSRIKRMNLQNERLK
jgi:TolB-like protein